MLMTLCVCVCVCGHMSALSARHCLPQCAAVCKELSIIATAIVSAIVSSSGYVISIIYTTLDRHTCGSTVSTWDRLRWRRLSGR